MYVRMFLKIYKLFIYNRDSILKNTIFVAEIVPNNYLNVTNMTEKLFNFRLSWNELVLLSEILKSYRDLLSESRFVDIDTSPGLKFLSTILDKINDTLKF